MPRIKEIAEVCGVTKPTITRVLKELGLWESHVSKSGAAYVVTNEAAAAVADALARRDEAPAGAPPIPAPPTTVQEDVYREYIDHLKAENERLWAQIREKDRAIEELTSKIVEAQRPTWLQRLLPGKRQ